MENNMDNRLEYDAHIFPNGRIALVNQSDFDEAINQGKEILIFCGGWSGGYAKAVGADKFFDPDFGECWNLYAYDIKDTTFSAEDMQKFHKVIITDGVKVYMQTGGPATLYDCAFVDLDTTFGEFKRGFLYDGETEEEFEKLRWKVDIGRTQKSLGRWKEAKDIWNSIKGFFRGIESESEETEDAY